MKFWSGLVLALVCWGMSQGQATSPIADDLVGNWKGKLEMPPISLRIFFQFQKQADGTLSGVMVSPDQSSQPITVAKLSYTDGRLEFEVPSIKGRYAGQVDPTSRTLRGKWFQGQMELPLEMQATREGWTSRRPQTPVPPFPYRVEQVSFENKAAGVTLAGTLTLPQKGTPRAAVILISGSGPQDRDEMIFEHRPFAVIADHLTRAGYAVLRYDDRGVGNSTGNFADATTLDFSRDAEAAFDYLRTRPDIRPDTVGLAGHSEGGMAAIMLAARRQDIAFAILLAAPGVSGHDIILQQNATFGRQMGFSEEFIQASEPHLRDLLTRLKAATSAKEKQRLLDDHFVRTEKLMTGKDRELYEKYRDMKSVPSPLLTEWALFFLEYDPSADLTHIRCPVLALNGEKDVQVLARTNLPALEKGLKAGGNQHITVQELPGLNHLFQKCATGMVSEYGEIEETVNPAALQAMSLWLEAELLPKSPAPVATAP